MGKCNALHVVLRPIFQDAELRECLYINNANVATVQFKLPDNCPHVEQLRKEGNVPWATSTIDFLK